MADLISGPNAAQAQAWNGYEGEHWAAHDHRYDAVNSGFNAFVLDAAGIGDDCRVLDIGCGTGQLTREAARRAPQGHATGVDLSAPMLARARARAAKQEIANVTFTRGDAQSCPFPPGGFDAAVSRFAVMFFADPVAAFANIGAALRPGGRLAFVSMAPMAGTDMGAIFGAVAAELPPPPVAPQTPSPLSLAEPGRIEAILTDAGFTAVTCARVEAGQVWGRDVEDAAAFIWGWGPVQFQAGRAGADTTARARAALTAALRPFETPAGVVTRGPAWLVTARRPGGARYDAG